MRRILSLIIILSICSVLVLTFSLIGCKTETVTETSEEAAEEAPAEEATAEDMPYAGITLTFAAQAIPLMNKAIELLPDFEAKTGIKVVPDMMPFDSMVQKITIDTTTNTKQYDVFWQEPTWYGRFVDEFQPLNDYIEDPTMNEDLNFEDFDQHFLQQSQMYGDLLFGLPFDACLMMPAYRTDIYEELGLEVPTTWTQYLENIKVISEETDIKGVSFMGKRGQPVWTEFWSYFWSFGANEFDEDMNPTINSPEAIEALEYVVELAEYAPDGVANFGWEESATEFLQGRAAHCQIFTDWIPALNDPESCVVVDDWNYMPAIGETITASPVGAYGIGMNKDIDDVRKKASFEFIKFMTSADMQKQLAIIGGCPSRTSVLNDPDFDTEQYKYFDAIMNTFPAEKGMLQIPEMFELQEALTVELSAAIAGDKTAKEALDTAQAAWETIMEEAGY